MKNNHIKIEQLIQQAIRTCGDDFALEDAKNQLRRALTSVQNVSKKRNKRNNAMEQAKEKALKKQEEWWNMIKENAKKSAENNLED